MIKSFFAGILFILITSCSFNEKEVTITKDYVINPNWSKLSNSFTITKMRFKDSIYIGVNEMTPYDVIRTLRRDSSFMFMTNVKYSGIEYNKRKVYFNKSNGFVWRKFPSIDPSFSFGVDSLGELKSETWYRLGGLSTIKTLYFIYIDANDSLHVIKVPAALYTNF